MLILTTSFGCFVNVFFCTLSISAQSIFSGRVTDRNGVAISGATIRMVGTNNLTASELLWEGHRRNDLIRFVNSVMARDEV